MNIFFKTSGTDKNADKPNENNVNFHRKLYIAYLNEASIESDTFRNQTFSTYVLKQGDTANEINRLPLILSVKDQQLLNEIVPSD